MSKQAIRDLWIQTYGPRAALPADLEAAANRELAEWRTALQLWSNSSLSAQAMDPEQGRRCAQRVRLWEAAIAAPVHFCALCNARLKDAVSPCERCCGADAGLGRCDLEAGHDGGHRAPNVVSPLPAWDDETQDDTSDDLPVSEVIR